MGIAKSNNLKIFVLKCKSDYLNTNIESKARHFRYKEAIKISKELNINTIITAHHEDDQIETVYMAEKNNSSWVSKIGIRPNLSLFNDEHNKIQLIRPMLEITKIDILEYSKKYKIDYVEDPTNKDIRFKRNKVRKEIKNYIDDNTFRNHYLDISNNNQNKMKKISLDIKDEYINIIDTAQYKVLCILDISKLMKGNFDFIHLFLKKVLHEIFDYKEDLSIKKWISITDFINSKNNGKYFSIDKGIELSKTRSKIYIYNNNSIFKNTKINYMGNYFYEIGCITAYKDDKFISFDKKQGICLPYNLLSKLTVENWSYGDKCSIKNKKSIKVSDIFINNKLSLFHKKKYPLIKHNNKIIWIPNLYCSKIENIDKFKEYLILRWNASL